MFDEKVTVRVVVKVRPVYGQQFLLTCNAALVEDAGDPIFQDSHQVRWLRKWQSWEQADMNTRLTFLTIITASPRATGCNRS